jgi:hypothetical protein
VNPIQLEETDFEIVLALCDRRAVTLDGRGLPILSLELWEDFF